MSRPPAQPVEAVGILADEEDDVTQFAFDSPESPRTEDGPNPFALSSTPGTDAVVPVATVHTLPPLLAGRYEVGDLIGRGGLCDVFAIRDVEALPDAPALVLKRLRVEYRNSAEAARMLKAQGDLLALIHHPNIVRFVAAGDEHGEPWVVMERIVGASLGHRLRQSGGFGLNRDAVAGMLTDLIAALRYLHDRGFVHGDLKPGNILIGDDGRACLVDPLPSALRREQPITPQYASPERAAGCRPATADDVYSLALVTYEAITGQHPFNRIPPAEALARRRFPVRPAKLDRAQWRFLSRLLTGNARWSTAVAEFARLAWSPERRVRRRDRFPIVVLLLLLALAGAVAIKHLL